MVILLAAADTSTSRQLLDWLRAGGHLVMWVHDGPSEMAQFHRVTPDVLIVGSGLPVLDAVAVCSRVRCWSELPIVVLGSDRGVDGDVGACVEALEAGANDYVKTPIHEHEFAARLDAAVRRTTWVPPSALIQIGDVQIYPREFRAMVGDKDLHLRAQEFRLLLVLARECGTMVASERLIEPAWNTHAGPPTLRTHVYSLRRKMRDTNARIVNTHGTGYRLLAIASPHSQPVQVGASGHVAASRRSW